MFCKKFMGSVKKLFNKIDQILADNAAIAIKVTTAIKDLLGSPVVSTLILLTKTKIDDALQPKVIAALDAAIISLSIVDSCKEQKDFDTRLKCFVAELEKVNPKIREAILIKLASLITGKMDNNANKQSLYDALVQGLYSASRV